MKCEGGPDADSEDEAGHDLVGHAVLQQAAARQAEDQEHEAVERHEEVVLVKRLIRLPEAVAEQRADTSLTSAW